MTHEELVPLIREATKSVFSMMLGIELEDLPSSVDESASGPTEGVVALIGLAGDWAGSGTFSCTAAGARRLSGNLLMAEFAAVDDEVLDAVGEIANMVLGNVKTALEERLGPMGLSIPTVIYGRNFTTRSVSRSKWTLAPFRFEDEVVEVHMCLAPSKDRPSRNVPVGAPVPAVLSIQE